MVTYTVVYSIPQGDGAGIYLQLLSILYVDGVCLGIHIMFIL